jgi:O-acetyl-ADP-ribose deacetylase (regulator of RNase III)
MDRASGIAASETKKFLEKNNLVEKVLLVCFGRAACEIYSTAVKRIVGSS